MFTNEKLKKLHRILTSNINKASKKISDKTFQNNISILSEIKKKMKILMILLRVI